MIGNDPDSHRHDDSDNPPPPRTLGATVERTMISAFWSRACPACQGRPAKPRKETGFAGSDNYVLISLLMGDPPSGWRRSGHEATPPRRQAAAPQNRHAHFRLIETPQAPAPRLPEGRLATAVPEELPSKWGGPAATPAVFSFLPEGAPPCAPHGACPVADGADDHGGLP